MCTDQGAKEATCEGYECLDTYSCKTSCTSNNDCVETHYCNASGKCVVSGTEGAGAACVDAAACADGLKCDNNTCCDQNSSTPCCTSDQHCGAEGDVYGSSSIVQQSLGNKSGDGAFSQSEPANKSNSLMQLFYLPDNEPEGYINSVTLALLAVPTKPGVNIKVAVVLSLYQWNQSEDKFDHVATSDSVDVSSATQEEDAVFNKPKFSFDSPVPLQDTNAVDKYMILLTSESPKNVKWFKTKCKNNPSSLSCNPIQDVFNCDSWAINTSTECGSEIGPSSSLCSNCSGTNNIPLCISLATPATPKPSDGAIADCLDDSGDFYFKINYTTDYCNMSSYTCMGTP